MRELMIVMLSVSIATGCATTARSELDSEVNRLCGIDGGIKTYETVKLPPQKFDNYGAVNVPLQKYAKPDDEYYYRWERTYYKRGNPEIWRDHFLLYRAVDHKLLGEAISYSRRGGDIPSPMHESSYGCPPNADISVLEGQVFTPNRER